MIRSDVQSSPSPEKLSESASCLRNGPSVENRERRFPMALESG